PFSIPRVVLDTGSSRTERQLHIAPMSSTEPTGAIGTSRLSRKIQTFSSSIPSTHRKNYPNTKDGDTAAGNRPLRAGSRQVRKRSLYTTTTHTTKIRQSKRFFVAP